MPHRPCTVLAMSPDTHRMLFTDELLDELAGVATVDRRLVVDDFADPAYAEALARAEVLLTGWGCPPVTDAALARMPRLRAIVHAAGTVKGHVTDECWARGLAVSSAAAANAVPVAEYTLAAILFAGKGVLSSAALLRERRGMPAPIGSRSVGNYGSTVGLVGASLVGRRVAALLRPFDLRVLIHDPYVTEADIRALGAQPADLDDLVRRSDILSIHAPELPETRHLIDRRRLALLRDGATLINTARGSLVDTAALTEHLVAGRLSAVLDVTDPEPLPPDSPLYDLPNVLLTPHVAGAQGNELDRLVRSAIAEIGRSAEGRPFRHAVTRAELTVRA